MRSWTLHLPPGAALPRPGSVPSTEPAEVPARPPLLLPERFSVWAFLFGPFWLFRHRCWLAGLAALALAVGAAFLPDPWGAPVSIGLQILLGLHGHDLRRWTLARRGWTLARVVLGADEDAAVARAVTQEPRLVPMFAAEWRK